MNKVFLIDIDGTICDDIKNEDSHLYSTANHFQNALDIINKWYDDGNVITFFTARESKDREITEVWLRERGFKYHGLVMDKPRINKLRSSTFISLPKSEISYSMLRTCDGLKSSSKMSISTSFAII